MDERNFDDLPWNDIKEVSEKGIFELVFNKIPKTRLKFVADEANRDILIKSALKSLQRSNPDTTYEQAAALADLMRTYAKKMLEGQNF